MLSLRQVDVVRAVLLTRSVSGAAQLLNVSAAAVSRMLRHTESQVGYPLFDRHREGFVPTPEARGLMDDLEAVHDGVRRIQARLDSAAQSRETLRIGASPGLSLSIVPRVLARMMRIDPDFTFDLGALHIDEVVPGLDYGRYDFVLTIYGIDDPRVRTRQVAEGQLLCLMPAGHALAGRRTITPADLAGEDLIGFDPGTFQQAMIDRLFADGNVQPRYCGRCRLTVTAGALVRDGLGLTLLDSFTLFGEPPTGTVAVPLALAAPFPLNVHSSARMPLSQRAESFVARLSEMLAED